MDRVDDRGPTAQLVALLVADDAETWTAAGFTVDDDRVDLGSTTVRLVGRGDGGLGIVGWELAGLAPASDRGLPSLIDGLSTTHVERSDTVDPSEADSPGADGPGTGRPDPEPDGSRPETGAPRASCPPHPNGTVGLDHVVVLTPDLERTIDALGEVGLACRRIREATTDGTPVRQAFFKIGAAVLEVVSGDVAAGETGARSARPATFFGLAVDVDDLDATAALLGDGLGRIKGAVQSGRRIATLRHRTLGMSVSVAAMDHRGGRVDPAEGADTVAG